MVVHDQVIHQSIRTTGLAHVRIGFEDVHGVKSNAMVQSAYTDLGVTNMIAVAGEAKER